MITIKVERKVVKEVKKHIAKSGQTLGAFFKIAAQKELKSYKETIEQIQAPEWLKNHNRNV